MNKRGLEMLPDELGGLVLGIGSAFLIIMMLLFVLMPDISYASEVSDSYASLLENKVSGLKDVEEIIFYHNSEEVNIYLVYLGSEQVYYNENLDLRFVSERKGENQICFCSADEKKTFCEVSSCIFLDKPVDFPNKDSSGKWSSKLGSFDVLQIREFEGGHAFVINKFEDIVRRNEVEGYLERARGEKTADLEDFREFLGE
jgi:hypothetical protein